MKLFGHCSLLFSALLSLAVPAPARASDDLARLATVITYQDFIWFTGRAVTREDIEREVQRCADLGFKRFYLRIDCAGSMLFDTKVGTPYRWDGLLPAADYYAESLKNIPDPISIFANKAKSLGLEIYIHYPIRDRNATELAYNPKNPDEAELYKKVGRWYYLSDFLRDNPQFNLERRQGDVDFAKTPPPVISRIELFPAQEDFSVTPKDISIWESTDNLTYSEVKDGWTIRSGEKDGRRFYAVEGLMIKAPWVKIAQKNHKAWSFWGDPDFDWVRVYDEKGKVVDPSYFYSDQGDKPAVGEARITLQDKRRAKNVRGTPWNTWQGFRFNELGFSLSMFTPGYPPDRYLMGSPCFAYSEVREQEYKVIEELLSYPIDGVLIDMRTHTRGIKPELYGFNPPIAEAYKQRYGVDPRTSEYDRKKLEIIMGEFHTTLLAGISERVRAQGKKLVAEIEPPSETGIDWMPGNPPPWWDLGELHYDWPKWSEEKLVDMLMVMTSGFSVPWDARLREYVADVRTRSGLPVSVFYDPTFSTSPQSFKAFLKKARADANVSEVNIFEFIELDKDDYKLNIALRELLQPGAYERADLDSSSSQVK